MKHSNEEQQLDKLIKDAIINIKSSEFDQAKMRLCDAMLANDHTPEIHNLLGIIWELKGFPLIAMRHYRCAYVLDGTYKPAIINMIRCSEGKHKGVDFGIGFPTFERRLKRNGDRHG